VAAVTGSRHRVGATKPQSLRAHQRTAILREFRDELLKLCARNFWVFFAQGRQCQQNLCKWPHVSAMIGGDFDLLDPCFLVAVDSSEGEKKLLWSWQTPDEVSKTLFMEKAR
jgi:hypothetical protein